MEENIFEEFNNAVKIIYSDFYHKKGIKLFKKWRALYLLSRLGGESVKLTEEHCYDISILKEYIIYINDTRADFTYRHCKAVKSPSGNYMGCFKFPINGDKSIGGEVDYTIYKDGTTSITYLYLEGGAAKKMFTDKNPTKIMDEDKDAQLNHVYINFKTYLKEDMGWLLGDMIDYARDSIKE